MTGRFRTSRTDQALNCSNHLNCLLSLKAVFQDSVKKLALIIIIDIMNLSFGNIMILLTSNKLLAVTQSCRKVTTVNNYLLDFFLHCNEALAELNAECSMCLNSKSLVIHLKFTNIIVIGTRDAFYPTSVPSSAQRCILASRLCQ